MTRALPIALALAVGAYFLGIMHEWNRFRVCVEEGVASDIENNLPAVAALCGGEE